jgi:hypothetical protein
MKTAHYITLAAVETFSYLSKACLGGEVFSPG